MSGSGWESADLLMRFNRMTGRPSSDAMTDASKYARLADAQTSVLASIATVAPSALPHVIQSLTTADGGNTWTFGTDANGYPVSPAGNAAIFPSLASIPDYPWVPGVDYLDEGATIRLPNARQWAGPLFCYGVDPAVMQPAPLSATVAPVVQPAPARVLIVIEAVRQYAMEFARNPALAALAQNEWDREFARWMTEIRRHLRGTRRLGPLVGNHGIAGAFGPGWGGTLWS